MSFANKTLRSLDFYVEKYLEYLKSKPDSEKMSCLIWYNWAY